ncbi:MAG: winged helix-turn-helix domain-containing protein [Thermodesulfobacteriota bacterium]
MKTNADPLSIRSKIWIAGPEGEVVFGLGRLRMLEAIRSSGSIQAAAKELGMSYRAVWGRIKATEMRLGKELLVRSIGGSSKGGSQLTPFAIELMDRFRKLHQLVAKESDKLFEKVVISGNLEIDS